MKRVLLNLGGYMPAPLVKSLAKESKYSVKKVEAFWKEIKEALIKQGKDPKTDKRFYGLLVSILKKKLKIEDSSLVAYSTLSSMVGPFKKHHVGSKVSQTSINRPKDGRGMRTNWREGEDVSGRGVNPEGGRGLRLGPRDRTGPRRYICEECLTPVNIKDNFCFFCGSQFDGDFDEFDSLFDPIILDRNNDSDTKYICIECNSEIMADSVFCSHCGVQFELNDNEEVDFSAAKKLLDLDNTKTKSGYTILVQDSISLDVGGIEIFVSKDESTYLYLIIKNELPALDNEEDILPCYLSPEGMNEDLSEELSSFLTKQFKKFAYETCTEDNIDDFVKALKAI